MSIYTQHYTDPEEVAKKWSTVLAHLGIREAAGCAAFDTLSSREVNNGEKKQQRAPSAISGCALPQGWTLDYSAAGSDEQLQQQDAQSSDDALVLKAQPPKTRQYVDHPEKGDCLVARDHIKAGTTVVTEASVLHAPQDPSHFFVAAAGAKAIEGRSRAHAVASRAAAAAAAFIRLCYRATGEDEKSAAAATVAAGTFTVASSGRTSANAASSTFSLFRIMCPQWVGALIFTTLLRIGTMGGGIALDTTAPGWEVVGTFSACSCGGIEEPVAAASSGSTRQAAAADAFRRVAREESADEQAVREINAYRRERWAEWLCAAKLMHRLALRHLPPSPPGQTPQQLIAECLSAAPGSAAAKRTSGISDEALCALALDVNGFLSSDSIASFLSLRAQNARFSVGKSVLRALRSFGKNSTERQQQQHHLKPVQRLAYFLDALSSNAVEVSVPGVPKRLAVYPYLRLAEHECRPSCAISFLDAPPLHGSSAYVAATQLQWDDPVYGCLIAGGVRHAQLLKNEKVIDEVRHERSAAGHPMAAYGGGSAANLLLIPSVVCLTALRDVGPGEPISIAYTGSTLMTWHERQRDLISRYGFRCCCIWCVGFAPDLARAFRCPHCPKGNGVVCPRSDGSQLSLWECIQCGFRPQKEFVDNCCEAEANLARVKAESVGGLEKLVNDEHLHYSHAMVCRKLDGWADKAWRQQEAEVCVSVVEVLLRCIDRLGTDDIDGFTAVLKKALQNSGEGGEAGAASAASAVHAQPAMLPIVTDGRADRRGPSRWASNPPRDLLLAQFLELAAKANHAVGNAHTARWFYTTSLAIREVSGGALSWWCRTTRFMALTKSIADLMDSK